VGTAYRSGERSSLQLAPITAQSAAARPHHAYLFTNKRTNRIKVLVHDGVGIWLCARRLYQGRFDLANLRVIEQALAVPMKRFDRPMVGFLSREQMLAVMDISTVSWLGHRERLMLTLLYNTGARVSEIVGVRVCDVVLGPICMARDASNVATALEGHGPRHS